MQEYLERLAALIRAEKRKKCTELRLPLIHLEVLEYLSRSGKFENTPAAIAAHFGMTRGTMSQTLIALEKKSYIEKKNDDRDRRVVHVSLLPMAQAILKKCQIDDLYRKAEAKITPDQKPASLKQRYLDLYKALLKHSNNKPYKTESSLPFLNNLSRFEIIEEITTLIRAKEREVCTSHKIQWSHLQILEYLTVCNRFSCTATAIVHFLGMTRGTVSQSLILMEKNGYLTKLPDSKDKRIHHLKLLEKGNHFVQQNQDSSFSKHLSDIVQTLSSLSPTELFLPELISLQKTVKSPTFGTCNSCIHFNYKTSGFYCNFLHEKLSQEDSYKICQEHLVAI